MFLSSSRRADFDTPFNFHWILDDNGRMGLRINFPVIPENADDIGKIKGINIVKRHYADTEDELFLIISNKEDREIFYSLCVDLLNASRTVVAGTDLYRNVIKRLSHWQRFLSQGVSITLTEPVQMGLYAELSYLIHLTEKFGPEIALTSWVGPDFDKQDFSLESYLVEVKSFISSKGPIIKISSMHQLIYDIKPLYLLSYGISRSRIGNSIIELISQMRDLIAGLPEEFSRSFDNKLGLNNYFEGITEAPFVKFQTDQIKVYKVDDAFPKILPPDISEKIVSVQYEIDLSKCSEFERNRNLIF